MHWCPGRSRKSTLSWLPDHRNLGCGDTWHKKETCSVNRWANKETNIQKICYLFNIVTNRPILLVLSGVWIFLSLHTVMVKPTQCVSVCTVWKRSTSDLTERAKINKLITSWGCFVCSKTETSDLIMWHFSRPLSQLLTIQTSQLANNILIIHTINSQTWYLPDRLQDGGKWGYSNTSTNTHDDIVLKYILQKNKTQI